MLVILEGLDKTGKSTVAEGFRAKKRFEYLHMTAPAKWHTRDSYMAEMVHLLASTVGKNVVLDRSWVGELVWPHIFDRKALLTGEDCANLFAIADCLHGEVKRVYMHDPDYIAHLNRIAQFKEPTYDFEMARKFYEAAATSLELEFVTFQEAEARGWT